MNVSPRRSAPLLCLLGLAVAASLQSGATLMPVAAKTTQPRSVSVPMGAPTSKNPSNPLASHPWGVYQGLADPAWGPYLKATKAQKRLLSRIVSQPKAKFFGDWIPNNQIASKVNDYIDNATGGNSDVLVQMTLFRMEPWEQEACRRLPTKSERASYKTFVDHFARAIGNTHAAVVVQPDGPFLRCIPHNSDIPADLLKYAARTLTSLPNTSVYLEMGSADWFRGQIGDAVKMLLQEGVAGVRGFALDTSHFDSVANQIEFGSRIVKALAGKGAGQKHFVIDTSDNGRPFAGDWFHQRHPYSVAVGNADPCSSATQTHCVTLGIPPTTDVDSSRWPLTNGQRSLAAKYVDGYLWVSRPWLSPQSGPLNMKRALAEARYTPYQ
ncbi:MAG TPA: glycoside hydrolase family 6 protein [Nocardioides sp.]|nr:glycoside hydrolase family 6 protein [Nocardioides sp.]